MRRCRAFVLSCIRKKLAVEASAGYSFFFKFLLRKCGNIWNLCEVSPARLTEKCLYHYNGYDVDFMQNFTKPAVGEKKNMTKKQKRMLRNRSRRRRIRKQLLATARTRKAISEADFEGTATRMLSMEETSKANLLHWKVLQVRWVK